MKKLFVIFCLLLSGLSKAQQTAPLKEAFDDYLDKRYSTGGLDYTVASNRPCCWPAWGDILSSYLNMYKATGDKAYLNKFVKHTYGILGYNTSTNTYPYFWDFTSYGSCPGMGSISITDQEVMSFHYTGRMLKPMAEFVYLVKQVYPALQTESILASLGVPYTTYDSFANYVKGKVETSLNYSIANYYNSLTHRFSKTRLTISSPTATYCEINQASGWGCALLYAGKVNTSMTAYTSVGTDVTDFLKSELGFFPSNSSYTWFHNGSAGYREDVSHGATDLSLVMVGYELYGNGLWTTQQLNYFAHTFTYNIWDRVNGRFMNNVFGMLVDNDPNIATCSSTININGTPNFWGSGEVLGWMPIYQWDDPGAGSNSVYEVLLNQTVNLLDGSGALLPAGYCGTSCFLGGTQSLEGLTQVIRAQWREECVNLTLRNRDLNYNQDFNIKNKLVIDPGSQGSYCLTSSQNYPNSFADPVISTSEFKIEPGVVSNMVAGESITLLPGFSAKQGSQVSMYIQPSACSDGMRPANPSGKKSVSNLPDENNGALKSMPLQTENSADEDEIKAFKIFPNPGKDMVYISFTMPADKLITVEITDLYGQKVSVEMNDQQVTGGNYIIPFDGSSLEKGIYMCNLYLNGQLYKTEKLILSH